MDERRTDDDEFGAPTCPRYGIILREVPGALQCPVCAWQLRLPEVQLPPEFDGHDIHQR